MKHRRYIFLSILVSVFLFPGSLWGVAHAGDEGYFFVGPREVKKTKQIKKGTQIVAYHQRGVFVSDTADSPWYQAALFIQGTSIEDEQGKIIQDVALCEATDADGDLNWSIFWRPDGNTGSVAFKLGTGKWEGITGGGALPGVVCNRADGHTMPRYTIDWKVDPEDRPVLQALEKKQQFAYHDKGLSFHGPHITDFSRTLSNGTNLVISSQSGVLLSENPEAKSPRNHATCFDRGTTVKTATGNGDIMLLEDTDPDGDVVWLCHIWWYGKGPGTYEFIGGIGKWQGITGVGVTLGMLRARSDDHFMLKSEMHWNLPHSGNLKQGIQKKANNGVRNMVKKNSTNQGVAHNVYFALEDAADDQVEMLIEACHSYLSAHTGIEAFFAGRLVEAHQRPVNVRDFHVGLHIVFKDKEAHDVYQESDRHQAFIDHCQGNWASVRVFDTYVR